jgi:hypothetical protein
VIAAPVAAGAAPPIEVLRLECAARVTDQAAAIRCEWSAPVTVEAAGFRLWRYDPAVDRVRQIVDRSDDLGDTTLLDTAVRRGHRYTYVIQALTEDGRVVARSRAETVAVPDRREVEVLRLVCAVGPAGDVVGCEWSLPGSRDAEVVELWRSVNGGARELVERFRPTGPNAYRDPVPDGADRIIYAVLARDADGAIVARSRAERVQIPEALVPVIDQPVAIEPVPTEPTQPTVTVPIEPVEPDAPAPDDTVVAVPAERHVERTVEEPPVEVRRTERERVGR